MCRKDGKLLALKKYEMNSKQFRKLHKRELHEFIKTA